MKTRQNYIHLVHSQPADDCMTVPVFRSVGLVWVLVLLGCLAFHACAAYTIVEVVKCFDAPK